MAGKSDERKKIVCSFCGKTQDQVRRMVAGNGVFICDQCIDLCADIIERELNEETRFMRRRMADF